VAFRRLRDISKKARDLVLSKRVSDGLRSGHNFILPEYRHMVIGESGARC
jgi:hypothetical protein